MRLTHTHNQLNSGSNGLLKQAHLFSTSTHSSKDKEKGQREDERFKSSLGPTPLPRNIFFLLLLALTEHFAAYFTIAVLVKSSLSDASGVTPEEADDLPFL